MRYRAPEGTAFEGLDLRGGRQFVPVGGGALRQLDGGYIGYRLPEGFSLSGFGGAVSGTRFIYQQWPVNQDDLTYGPNWTAGGRAGWAYSDLVQLGLGYRHERLAGRMAFSEINWDTAMRPWSWAELLVDGVFDFNSGRLKQTRASLRGEVLPDLDAGVAYRYMAPDLFIARSSIFAIFSNELLQDFYGELEWAATRWLTLYGEVGGFIWGESCPDDDPTGICDDGKVLPKAMIRADVRYGFQGRHRASFEFERNGANDGGFWRWRGATRVALCDTLSAIVDTDFVLLDSRDDSVNFSIANQREQFAFTGGGFLSYDFHPNMSLLAGGSGMVSPLYDHAGTFTVRWNWTIDGKPSTASSATVAVARSSGGSGRGAL